MMDPSNMDISYDDMIAAAEEAEKEMSPADAMKEAAKEIKIDFLKPLIGIFILWFLFGPRPTPKDDHPNFIGVGFISGITTVFIGATGPLIAPFFLKGKLTKETIIANKAICQAISHIGKIPLFIFFFQFDYFAEMKLLITLVIAVFIGTNFGKKILAFIFILKPPCRVSHQVGV